MDDKHADLPGALLEPDAYERPVDRIELIETHLSWVFLAGEFAYKVKKPVAFAFVDFSTLRRRQQACRDEVALNRRLAPDLYLDVVPIGMTPTGLRIGATPATEYAVRMVRFDSDETVDRILDNGDLAADSVRDLAERIAQFHDSLEPAENAALDSAADANVRQLGKVLDPALSGRVEALRAWTATQAETLHDCIGDRQASGAIRECHGDLHLGNIVRTGSTLVPFDCLEFDRALRCIDRIDEVAFTVMDFMAHRRTDLAYEYLNRYLEVSGDYPGLRLLRYFLVYRALVRCKVQALSADAGKAGRRNAAGGRYLDLAERLIAPAAPVLIITHGFSASGKTAVTNELMSLLPAVRVRSDLERKRLHGLAAGERSGSGIAAGIYDAAATDAVYERLARSAEAGLMAGLNVIVDATFLARRQRAAFADIANRLAASFVILDLVAAQTELRRRIAARQSAGKDASEADPAVLDYQLANADPIDTDEKGARIAVDTGERVDIDSLVDRIVSHDERIK